MSDKWKLFPLTVPRLNRMESAADSVILIDVPLGKYFRWAKYATIFHPETLPMSSVWAGQSYPVTKKYLNPTQSINCSPASLLLDLTGLVTRQIFLSCARKGSKCGFLSTETPQGSKVGPHILNKPRCLSADSCPSQWWWNFHRPQPVLLCSTKLVWSSAYSACCIPDWG